MIRFGGITLLLSFLVASGALPASAQNRLPPDAPRPIDAGTSLWAEELTSMEIRDAIRAGTTTIISGTGGVEENGPYVVGGKHNYVLQTVLPFVARAIGNALIAPIVKFVPEGSIEPSRSDHMEYAGTISFEEATFEALLTDICRSYKAHGFVDIILVGDSGGNQTGMETVADALNRKWSAERARVHYLPEYYFEDRWSYSYVQSWDQGRHESTGENRSLAAPQMGQTQSAGRFSKAVLGGMLPSGSPRPGRKCNRKLRTGIFSWVSP